MSEKTNDQTKRLADAIDDSLVQTIYWHAEHGRFDKAKELILEAAHDAYPAHLDPGWISVEERLPKPLKDVLVWAQLYPGEASLKRVSVAWIGSTGDWHVYGSNDPRVIAWRPLPLAPTAKGGAL